MRAMMKKRIKHQLAMLNRPASGKVSQNFVAPVLCYHSVNPTGNPESDPMPPQLFEQHLAYLDAHRTVIPFRSLVESLLSGQRVPSDAVVITFDDGYRDNFEEAFPLLVKYGMHATLFVVTGFIDRFVDLNGFPGWEAMTWDQVRRMDASQMVEIGAHGHTHAILAGLSDRDALEEVRISKERLETELGHDVALFAYPYGQGQHISPAALRAVRDLGFLGACTTFWRTTHRLRDRFVIGRVIVSGDDDVEVLKAKLEGRYDYIHLIQRGRALLSRVVTGRGIW